MRIALRIGVLLCLLLVAAGMAPGQPPPVPAAVRLVSVTSTKVLYSTKEPITGTVTLKNATATAQTATVRAWLECEIDQAGPAQQKTVTVAPEQTAEVAFRWPQGLARYGHALKAEALVNGQVLARGEDYFNVSDQYWQVALPWAISCMWSALEGPDMLPRKDLSWMDGYFSQMRKDYFNAFEHFFWAEDDFLGMTPQREVWFSGQARYRETKVGLQQFIARAHANGIKAITYAKLTGGGTYGAEIARQNPEWVWQSGGVLAVDRSAATLAKWDDPRAKDLTSSWNAVNWNMNDPRVVEIGIKNLSDSATMFGWDGARWDGNFDVWSEVTDLDGKPVEKLTRDQRDARNAENMRRTKAYLSQQHPGFFYGYNWIMGNWRQTLANTPRESTELLRDGGLVMNEYIRGAAGVQHPLHRWETYAETLADDVEAVKQLGGYYGPIIDAGDNPDGKYRNIFVYAAGAHPYYGHMWGGFVTRYSAFLWDNALQRLHMPENILLAPDSVWWRHWVFLRPLDGKRRQLIVHLINPPAKPTVGEATDPQDVPAPLRNVQVRVSPTLLEGWRPVRATRVSPEPRVSEPVPVQPVEGIYSITVPEVALWTILVIDLQKKGGR